MQDLLYVLHDSFISTNLITKKTKLHDREWEMIYMKY